jgi:putative intracellular protease/amidase
MTKILFVITAATHWTLADGYRQPAGFWAEEALGPYAVFKQAGYEIAAATRAASRQLPMRSASLRTSTAAPKGPSR